jgi:hypothetical protein
MEEIPLDDDEGRDGSDFSSSYLLGDLSFSADRELSPVAGGARDSNILIRSEARLTPAPRRGLIGAVVNPGVDVDPDPVPVVDGDNARFPLGA